MDNQISSDQYTVMGYFVDFGGYSQVNSKPWLAGKVIELGDFAESHG